MLAEFLCFAAQENIDLTCNYCRGQQGSQGAVEWSRRPRSEAVMIQRRLDHRPPQTQCFSLPRVDSSENTSPREIGICLIEENCSTRSKTLMYLYVSYVQSTTTSSTITRFIIWHVCEQLLDANHKLWNSAVPLEILGAVLSTISHM